MRKKNKSLKELINKLLFRPEDCIYFFSSSCLYPRTRKWILDEELHVGILPVCWGICTNFKRKPHE